MHERSLVRGLLRQVRSLADDHPASRVLSIRVRIGEFAGVEPELLITAYQLLVAETPFFDVPLIMDQTPLQAACGHCNREFPVERYVFRCPVCGSRNLTILGGEEMLLESVTLEVSDP